MTAGLHAGISPAVFWTLTPAEFRIWVEAALPAAEESGFSGDPAALKALMERGFAD